MVASKKGNVNSNAINTRNYYNVDPTISAHCAERAIS